MLAAILIAPCTLLCYYNVIEVSMPQIKPITDLRNTNEISELCHDSDEPIFITKNGYGDMVVMSMETYERDVSLVSIYRKLASAQQQVDNGETESAEKVFDGLRKKHGYKI
jgi:PHD/YefM family antitoxin component YafN of YafNO toxin-antitoxin module